MKTENTQPLAAGQAAHTLLPEYKATNSSRYHIAQKVQTDTGITIWRQIATFNDEQRRDEVLRSCNSHAALVAALEADIAMYEGIAPTVRRICQPATIAAFEATFAQSRAALQSARA